jgi:hypothetical protein
MGKRGRVKKSSNTNVSITFDDGSDGRTVPKFVEIIVDYCPGTEVRVIKGTHVNKIGVVN